MQNPFNKSAAEHPTSKYKAALLAVILTQLVNTKRHPDGLEGVAELLKSAPIVRDALDSLSLEVVGDFFGQIRALTQAGLESSGAASTLRRLQSIRPSRDISDDGRSEKGDSSRDLDISGAGVPAPGEPGHQGGYAPIAQLDDEAGDGESGDALAPHVPVTADVEAGPAPLQQEQTDLAATMATPWRRALNSVVQWRKGGGAASVGTACKQASATAAGQGAPPLPRIGHRCYVIPETGAAAQGEDSTAEGAGDASKGSRSWTCPLACSAADLPQNARLSGNNVLEIGEAPDMRSAHAPPARWRDTLQLVAGRKAERARRAALSNGTVVGSVTDTGADDGAGHQSATAAAGAARSGESGEELVDTQPAVSIREDLEDCPIVDEPSEHAPQLQPRQNITQAGNTSEVRLHEPAPVSYIC